MTDFKTLLLTKDGVRLLPEIQTGGIRINRSSFPIVELVPLDGLSLHVFINPEDDLRRWQDFAAGPNLLYTDRSPFLSALI